MAANEILPGNTFRKNSSTHILVRRDDNSQAIHHIRRHGFATGVTRLSSANERRTPQQIAKYGAHLAIFLVAIPFWLASVVSRDLGRTLEGRSMWDTGIRCVYNSNS